jgi:hypothetical protein
VVSDAFAGFDIVLLNISAVSHLCLGSETSSPLDLALSSLGLVIHLHLSILPGFHGSNCYPVNVSFYVGGIAELCEWKAKVELLLRPAVVHVE